MLLGSLQAACSLGVIKEDLGVSVTVVVSMCETEMNVYMELHRIGMITSVSTM